MANTNQEGDAEEGELHGGGEEDSDEGRKRKKKSGDEEDSDDGRKRKKKKKKKKYVVEHLSVHAPCVLLSAAHLCSAFVAGVCGMCAGPNQKRNVAADHQVVPAMSAMRNARGR